MTREPRTWRVSGQLDAGTAMLVAALLVALLGVFLVAFGALPAAVLLLAAVPLALSGSKLIKRGRPRGTA